MIHFRSLIFSVYVFLIISLAGCLGIGGNENSQPVNPPTKIAVSLADMERDGSQTVRQVMEERSQGEQLDITFMDAGNNAMEQERHIDRVIEDEAKAVIIQFIDPQNAHRLVQKLKQENIKIVALENLPFNTPVDGYVASDHAMTGELQVRYISEALRMAGDSDRGAQQSPDTVTRAIDPGMVHQLPPGRPLNVMILQGDRRDQAAVGITEANIAAVEANPDLNLTRIQENPLWDTALVTTALSEMMASDRLPDVVLANDSSLAIAAVEFFKEARIDRRVVTVGAGADRDSTMAILNGEHDGEVDPMPEMLAAYALDAARDLAKNGHWQFDSQVQNGDYCIPAKIVPVRLIGRNNVFLLQDRWDELKEKMKKRQQENEQQQAQGQQQQGQQGQEQQGNQGSTMVRITTEEGETMELMIDGTVQKIESLEGEEARKQGQKNGGKQGEEGDGEEGSDGQGGGGQ